MKHTRHSGFTMIELIFVIVILGILSAIALPKFIGVQNSAVAQKVVSFVGTMNRTTLPSMYASVYQDGGSIKDENLSAYITVPKEIIDLNITNCGTTYTQVATTTIGAIIYCRDGNTSSSAQFAFSTDGNTSLASSYFK